MTSLNPFQEYLMLVRTDSRRYFFIYLLCLILGVMFGSSPNLTLFGIFAVIVFAFICSRNYKATGYTGYWFTRPLRPWVLGLNQVTQILLACIAHLLGAFLISVFHGIYPDLAFWVLLEKLPKLLLFGLFALGFFSFSSTGLGFFRTLIEFFLGFFLLFITLAMFDLFRLPSDHEARFLLTIVSCGLIVAGLLFRYFRRFKPFIFGGTVVIGLILLMSLFGRMKIDWFEEDLLAEEKLQLSRNPQASNLAEDIEMIEIPIELAENEYFHWRGRHFNKQVSAEASVKLAEKGKVPIKTPYVKQSFLFPVDDQKALIHDHISIYGSKKLGELNMINKRFSNGTHLFSLANANGWRGYYPKVQKYDSLLSFNPANHLYREELRTEHTVFFSQGRNDTYHDHTSVSHKPNNQMDWTFKLIEHRFDRLTDLKNDKDEN